MCCLLALIHFCILLDIVFAGDVLESKLQFPLVKVLEIPAEDLTLEEFVSLSYQPVLVTGALSDKTLENLKPWNFARLNSSLEAATTFCTAERNLSADSRDKQSYDGIKLKDETISVDRMTEASLRRFGLDGPEFSTQAFVNVTKDIGLLIDLPVFLGNFEFDSVIRAGLHYTRAGWLSQVDQNTRAFYSTSVVCLLEGHHSIVSTPYRLPWEHLKCGKDSCSLKRILEEFPDLDSDNQVFFVQAELKPRDCLFSPLEWQWSASASVDSLSLRIFWEDDLVIREDLLEDFLEGADDGEQLQNGDRDGPPESDRRNRHHQKPKRKNLKNSAPKTLWAVLPRAVRPSTPMLWSEKNPLLHLVRYYVLSSQQRNMTKFLKDFRVDRILLPDLVDCPSECQAAARNIFLLLDTDSDGVLTDQDALHLTQSTFDDLSSELDDLTDELKALAVEQWNDIARGGDKAKFLERAKDRMVEGARVGMKRWINGDVGEDEEKELRESSPDIYNDILEARMRKRGIMGDSEKDEL